MNIGDKVIYKNELGALIKGEVGIINFIGEIHVSIIYPQNSCYDENGKEKKDFPKWRYLKQGKVFWIPYVYAHSAKFDEIEVIPTK